MIQTVDSEKLATKLDAAWSKLQPASEQPLQVLIQINTSGEEGESGAPDQTNCIHTTLICSPLVKSGIEAKDAPALYQFIRSNLKHLNLMGIMTIGAFGFDYSNGPNPDFVSLLQVHRSICEANSLPPDSVLVSMGMSNDFDKAVSWNQTGQDPPL